MTSKKLIINADDYGMSDSFNEAITDLLKNEHISSTTLMAVSPGFENAVKIIKAENLVDVGLHITLTCDRFEAQDKITFSGLTSSTSIHDERRCFYSEISALHHNAVTSDIIDEIYAQMELLYLNGINFSHIDNHMFSLMPRMGYRGWKAFYVAYSKFVKIHGKERRGFRCAKHYQVIPHTNTVAYAGKKLMPYLRLNNFYHKLKMPDQVISYPYFTSGSTDLLDSIFRSIRPGLTELLVHPCVYFKGIEKQNPYWENLVGQYHDLKKFTKDMLLDVYGVTLTSYRELLGKKGCLE